MTSQSQVPVTQRAKRLYKQAEQALLTGRIAEAQEKGERLVETSPQYDNGWFLLSLVYQQQGRETEGLKLIDRAIVLSPNSVHYQAQRSALLLRLGDFQQALQQAQAAVAIGVDDSWSLDVLGVVFSTLDEQPQALPLFAKACQQQPNNPQFLYNLASAERVCGQLPQAAQHLKAALQVKPGFAKAQWSLSTLEKVSATENHTELLAQKLQADNLQPMDRCYLSYALAKEYEDLEQWDKAFDSFQKGAKVRSSLMPYSREQSEQLFSALKQAYPQPESDTKGYDCDEPIFIVGMPRTGTTLVERILSAHTEVYAAGELRQFPMAVAGLLKEQGGGKVKPEVMLTPAQIEASLSLDFKALGQTYIDATRPRTGHTPRFIDKLPLNFLYLGLIAKALPKAKFIHLVRNPMDTCWSNFKQLFGMIYPYSYDLEDTAHFYLLYRDLMEHWNTLMPGRIHTVEYEQVVSDQETETRRLLEFCDLSWQQECMEFHKSDTAVATASSTQVRQPVYSSSVQRWQKYRKHLEGVERKLQVFCK